MNTYYKKHRWSILKFFGMLCTVCILTFICATPVFAAAVDNGEDAAIDVPSVGFNVDFNAGTEGESMAATIQILLLLTVIALAPSILIMVTSFVRIIIVLHFSRAALGTMTTPPNQVLIALALFLTLFIMTPVFSEVNAEALQPLSKGEITQQEAFDRGIEPLRQFMFGQTRGKDLKLFMDIANIELPENTTTEDTAYLEQIPTSVLIPSFLISELRIGFIIGFIIYIPFIIVDMVVASTLMSMGMMMLPPTTISMPFKILLFILADGWNLVIGSLVKTFLRT